MPRIIWPFKEAICKKFGSQVEAARAIGIREARLSYLVRGHEEPTERERELLLKVFRKDFFRSAAARRESEQSGIVA